MKKIAIVGYNNGPNSFGVGKTYLSFISNMGAVPIIIYPHIDEDYHKEIIEKADMLIMPGGPDLSSHFYGEAPDMYNSDPCRFREFFFSKALPHYVGEIPILGICLGFQMLNVYFGGKLIQDLPTSFHSSDKRGEFTHRVIPVSQNNGGVIYRERNSDFDSMWVNTHHHQAVPISGLGEGLLATHLSYRIGEDTKKQPDLSDLVDIADRDERWEKKYIIEGFKHESLDIYGVQWHPEEIYDKYTTSLIDDLIWS